MSLYNLLIFGTSLTILELILLFDDIALRSYYSVLLAVAITFYFIGFELHETKIKKLESKPKLGYP